MERRGSIVAERRTVAGAGMLALGLAVSCGGTTRGESRSTDPSSDASSGSVAWCTGAIALSSGSQGDGTCVVKSDGSLWCWGANGCGSLGIAGQLAAAPMAVPRDGLGSGVKSVSAGWGKTCAVERAGAAVCFGSPLPGDGGTCSEAPTPTSISGLPNDISAVATGNDHACALAADGSVWCWGTNTNGQLGDGTTVARSTARRVVGLTSRVTAISSGYGKSCAIEADGSLWCWGANFNGELGDGTLTTRTTPVPVFGMASGVAGVSVGSQCTCAVKTDGTTWCWGGNRAGELGDGTTVGSRLVPTRVKLPLGAKAVAGGYSHTCAVAVDGTAWCWGDNDEGQLGRASESCDGALCWNPIPARVAGLPPEVVAITAEYHFTCALERDGTVWCWGLNTAGQLGDGTRTSRWTPERVLPCGG